MISERVAADEAGAVMGRGSSDGANGLRTGAPFWDPVALELVVRRRAGGVK